MRPNHTKNINKNHNPIINKLTFFFGRKKHNQIKTQTLGYYICLKCSIYIYTYLYILQCDNKRE